MIDDKYPSVEEDKFSSDSETSSEEVWPRKLNKLIIGVGIIAFGLIIADRLINAFQAEDTPQSVALEDADQVPAQKAPELAGVSGDENAEQAEQPSASVTDASLNIEDVFGSRLVFVSASEPLYVLTVDERRYDVGVSVDEQTTLAGITGQRVILEREGELMVINLPEPSAN